MIELLRKNTPEYFAAAEEKDLSHYLAHEMEDYFVFEKNHIIQGAGGINYFPAEQTARLSWDLIDPAHQGTGIGSALTRYRIDMLKKQSEIHHIMVRTSQLVYPFYEKMGFKLELIEKDYWAKNFDLYLMKMSKY